MKKRYNVGLVVANITDPFSNAVAKGAMAAAENLDINLTIFPAKYVDYTCSSTDGTYEYQYNALLSHAATGGFDYVIVAIGTVAYLSDNKRKKEILDIFHNTPILSVSANIDGYDYVQYDNTSGITQAVNYLAKSGRKHICMMIGDLTNNECLQRFEAYRKAIANNGLEYHDTYVMSSDISEDCENEVALLIKNNAELDAVLCVNDMVATTVCKMIKKTHRKVGQDVAVVGFDDLPFATKLDPPLASVRADAANLGYRSVEKAVNFLDGVKDDEHLLGTMFIPRASCVADSTNDIDMYEMFSGNCEEISENIMAYISVGKEKSDNYYVIKNFCIYIVSLIKSRIANGNANEADIKYISSLFENFFDEYINYDETLLKIMDILDLFNVWITQKCKSDSKTKAADSFRKTAYKKVIGGLISNLNSEKNKIFDQNHNFNLVVRETLMFSENLNEIYANILAKLYCLNIKRSYLYLLDEPTVYQSGTFFPMNVQWNFKSYQCEKNTYSITNSQQRIGADKLYANEYIPNDERHTFVVADLYSREYQYGILLCEPESDQFFANLEFTVYQMSTAVKISEFLYKQESMFNELHKNNLAFEKMSKVDELTGIYNRRGFYAAANNLIMNPENIGKFFIVCYADMDNLKMVNDSYGHIEGDFSLKALADCLVKVFGQNGVVGRMGGDEFAAIIRSDLAESKDKISQSKEHLITELNKSACKPYKINMSMGIYECLCDNSYSLKDAIDKADDILYTIKAKRKKEI